MKRALAAEAKLQAQWKQPTPAEPLTTKQQELYDYLVQFVQEHSYFPTFREIAKDIDNSVSTIHRKMQALAKRGLVENVGQRLYRLVRGD